MKKSTDHQPRRPIILAFTTFYLPGYKAGGPIRSVSNLAEALGDEFDFRIVTLDRDLGAPSAYSGIQINKWQQVGKAKVFYAAPDFALCWRILRLLRHTEYDLLYLNSFFARTFSMLPYWVWGLGIGRQVPLLMAPRGEFSPGALQLRSLRKSLYIKAVSLARLSKKTLWHASSGYEAKDISNLFGNRTEASSLLPPDDRKIFVALDLANFRKMTNSLPNRKKTSGSLDLIFISRISRKKNLDFALRILPQIHGKVHFDIYGPIEDAKYWEECKALIKELPQNIVVDYRGELAHKDVGAALEKSHLFLFPTLGENFGHVIAEALNAGCPVLISDQTPWRGLKEKGSGWDLPLEQPEGFRKVIEECVAMDDQPFQKISEQARRYGQSTVEDPMLVEQNRLMLFQALQGQH